MWYVTDLTCIQYDIVAVPNLITLTIRLPVNSSHGQLVTRSTRHTVNSSQRGGQLVTSKHQSHTATAVITLTRSPRSLPLLKKCTRNWAENKVNNKAHTVCDCCSNQLLCSSWNQCSPGPIITACHSVNGV